MAHYLLRSRSIVLPKATAFVKTSPVFPFVRYKHGGAKPMQIQPRKSPLWRSSLLEAQNVVQEDIGLLNDTFIMPTGSNLPGLFAQPGVRFKLTKAFIKQRILDVRDMAIFRWFSKQKLHLREPKKVAPALHHDMYTALAEGDLETLRLICGKGLLSSFTRRIYARRGVKMQWKRHRLLSRPKVVSNKAHHYLGQNITRRQAVIKIHSLQSLEKFTPNGQLVEGSDTPKEVVEYLVVEKKYDSGKESPWYVWGTTEETTLERLETEKKRQAEKMKMMIE